MEETRRCRKPKGCGADLPLTAFRQIGVSKTTGLPLWYTYCRDCERQIKADWHAANRARIQAKVKQWRKDNAEHVREYWREYRTIRRRAAGIPPRPLKAAEAARLERERRFKRRLPAAPFLAWLDAHPDARAWVSSSENDARLGTSIRRARKSGTVPLAIVDEVLTWAGAVGHLVDWYPPD